ncbi:hypothetical protein MA16_Dca024101 [Dendrobium catenatum]|uniref:Uncharacterized protein n=1 Tax=Dendrobium catenatum TaxID=906689 RepID=A0A2I0VA05_9ASPA|nr:hypothetical protein MA16_Dca024101 [Dendrobium catenatum]
MKVLRTIPLPSSSNFRLFRCPRYLYKLQLHCRFNRPHKPYFCKSIRVFSDRLAFSNICLWYW